LTGGTVQLKYQDIHMKETLVQCLIPTKTTQNHTHLEITPNFLL